MNRFFDFSKSFGLGLLLMIFSPLLLALLVLVGLYGIFNFFVEGGKATIRFFKGQKPFQPFPEDVKAKEIIARKAGLVSEGTSNVPAAAAPASTTVYVQQNYYQSAPPSPNPVTPSPALSSNPLPTLPQERIPNIPGVDPKAIEEANVAAAARILTANGAAPAPASGPEPIEVEAHSSKEASSLPNPEDDES